MSFERELEAATETARKAGELLLQMYSTTLEIAFKSQTDPVTEADTRTNTFIVKELRQRFPSYGIVAEETADHSDALSKEYCWYIDPLDGTKEFIARNGEFSVMIGLTIKGEARLGAVYQPTTDKLYSGIVGEGAHLSSKGTKTSLHVSTIDETKNLKLVTSRSHRSNSIDIVTQRLGVRHEIQSGSVGLKVGLIAEQVADFYVHVSDKSSVWDTCGPEAILRAAGGRFTDLDGKPFNYAKADMRNRKGILACNAAAFEQVLEVAKTL